MCISLSLPTSFVLGRWKAESRANDMRGDGHKVVEGDLWLEELGEGHDAEDEKDGEGAAGLEDPGCSY